MNNPTRMHGLAAPVATGAPTRPMCTAASVAPAIAEVRPADAPWRRLLLTLLFTDIVGSTRLAERLGDQAWRTLLHRHRAIVRAQLARLGGVEVDCCGDGFFAVFPVPALALRCAAGAAHALLAAGVEIRAGVHTGECDVEAGNSVSGIAVHVAARIASLARPREILVSDTVRDLVAGSGLAFADRGRRTLKGLAGSRRLFSLDAERACADAGAADESCTGASRHAANDERMTGRPGLQQLTDRSVRPSAS